MLLEDMDCRASILATIEAGLPQQLCEICLHVRLFTADLGAGPAAESSGASTVMDDSQTFSDPATSEACGARWRASGAARAATTRA